MTIYNNTDQDIELIAIGKGVNTVESYGTNEPTRNNSIGQVARKALASENQPAEPSALSAMWGRVERLYNKIDKNLLKASAITFIVAIIIAITASAGAAIPFIMLGLILLSLAINHNKSVTDDVIVNPNHRRSNYPISDDDDDYSISDNASDYSISDTDDD